MASRRERVRFTGAGGDQLAGRVELPAGPIRGAALFAHCFTCSSDVAAASRISVALAEAGIAVMRFDFTGLGASEGDFADTNFSTNVADLIAASSYLSDHFQAPGLLIGHSLGGAAVLAAAPELDSVKAVVTIGAPSEPSHVEALLGEDRARLETDGEATIDIGGRPFRVKAQLLEDLRHRTIDECLADLGAALLVMHSPVDNVVGVGNAAEIYQAARHPKSFIALDGADHLLSKRRDSDFAASMIRAWVERYLDDAPETKPADGEGVVVSEMGEGKFLNQVVAGAHRFLMDEPISVGGYNAGPNPYDLLAAALGGCTSMTMRMYAEHKGIPLERVEVAVRHATTHCEDCEAAATGATPKIDEWTRVLHIDGDITDDQRAGLVRIADVARCTSRWNAHRSWSPRWRTTVESTAETGIAPHQPGRRGVAVRERLDQLEAVPRIERHVLFLGRFDVGTHALLIAAAGDRLYQGSTDPTALMRRIGAEQGEKPMWRLGGVGTLNLREQADRRRKSRTEQPDGWQRDGRRFLHRGFPTSGRTPDGDAAHFLVDQHLAMPLHLSSGIGLEPGCRSADPIRPGRGDVVPHRVVDERGGQDGPDSRQVVGGCRANAGHGGNLGRRGAPAGRATGRGESQAPPGDRC